MFDQKFILPILSATLLVGTFLLADDNGMNWSMPGQNPGHEDAALPGNNPNESSFPNTATPPTKARVPEATRPGPYGY